MSSHTPGPWEFDTDGEVFLGDQINMLKDDIDTERQWLSIGTKGKEGFAEVVALAHPTNAVLIAAAPSLLTALESAVESLSGFGCEDVEYYRTIIRKAKGESP